MYKPNEGGFVPISPQTLRPNTKGMFDVYLFRGGNYVLFNTHDGVFTKARCQELVDNRISTLYIEQAGLRQYQQYVQQNIGDLLSDETVHAEERSRLWLGTVTEIGREMFESNLPGPTFRKRFERFEKLLEQTAGFVKSPRSLKYLSRFIVRGRESYHHGISTMVYSVNLMSELGMDHTKTLACGMGAMFHDMGKAGLPEGIKNKKEADLTDADKEVLALHPMIGVRTCSAFNLPQAAINCILFHHERDDGAGYPTRAHTNEVPRFTKVVRLCNRYDNLTRKGVNGVALTPFEALKSIMEDDGFVDRALLKSFVEMMSKAEIL